MKAIIAQSLLLWLFPFYFIATFKEIMPFHYNNIKF